MACASLRISTLSLLIVISALFTAEYSHAEEVTEISEPNIEAKVYDVTVIRPSRSGRVYLFTKPEASGGLPADGKIFLLRDADRPVMAFRVLKTYPASGRIAAKKILPYPGFDSLEKRASFRAFEKVGDRIAPVPPSSEDLSDLKELEAGTPEEPPLESAPATEPAGNIPPETPVEVPPDAQTAVPTDGSAPVAELPSEEEPTQGHVAADDEFLEEPKDENLELSGTEEEDEIGNYYPNQFTMAVGLLFNGNVPGPNPKFGGGFLYARNLMPSLALEGGLYYYRSTGALPEGSSNIVTMTVIPLTANIRYQQSLNAAWTGYIYGGMTFSYISSQIGATKRQVASASSPLPSLGVGAFLQTGPNWYLRFNLGYPESTIGIMLRY
jgi:hypothetical protein